MARTPNLEKGVPQLTGDAAQDIENLRAFIHILCREVSRLPRIKHFKWTPSLTFATPGDLSVAYTRREGIGTVVDEMVFLWWQIFTSSFTHTTASGIVTITGNTILTANVTGQVAYGTGEYGGITLATKQHIVPRMVANESAIRMSASGSGVAAADVTAADMPTGGTVGLRGAIVFRRA